MKIGFIVLLPSVIMRWADTCCKLEDRQRYACYANCNTIDEAVKTSTNTVRKCALEM